MRRTAPVRGATAESLGVPHVRDLMDRKPVIVRPEMLLRDVGRALLKKRADGAAVVDDDGRYLGLISAQGLLTALNQLVYDEAPPGPAKHHLDPELPSLSEDAGLMAAAQLFAKRGHDLWAVPVLRDERLVGVVKRLDVVRSVLEYVAGGRRSAADTLYISALRETHEKPPY